MLNRLLLPAFAATILLLLIVSALASPMRPRLCVTPEMQLESFTEQYDGVEAHVLSEIELAEFTNNVHRGADVVIWYSRPGISTVFIAMYVGGCRKHAGELPEVRFRALAGIPVQESRHANQSSRSV